MLQNLIILVNNEASAKEAVQASMGRKKAGVKYPNVVVTRLIIKFLGFLITSTIVFEL
jgi:hypothetical protein